MVVEAEFTGALTIFHTAMKGHTHCNTRTVIGRPISHCCVRVLQGAVDVQHRLGVETLELGSCFCFSFCRAASHISQATTGPPQMIFPPPGDSSDRSRASRHSSDSAEDRTSSSPTPTPTTPTFFLSNRNSSSPQPHPPIKRTTSVSSSSSHCSSPRPPLYPQLAAAKGPYGLQRAKSVGTFRGIRQPRSEVGDISQSEPRISPETNGVPPMMMTKTPASTPGIRRMLHRTSNSEPNLVSLVEEVGKLMAEKVRFFQIPFASFFCSIFGLYDALFGAVVIDVVCWFCHCFSLIWVSGGCLSPTEVILILRYQQYVCGVVMSASLVPSILYMIDTFSEESHLKFFVVQGIQSIRMIDLPLLIHPKQQAAATLFIVTRSKLKEASFLFKSKLETESTSIRMFWRRSETIVLP